MTDEREGGIADGIRTGIGLLSAFRDALEETIDEAIARGAPDPERAKGVIRDASELARNTLSSARERLDVVSRAEHEALRREVEALRARLDQLEGATRPGAPASAADAGPSVQPLRESPVDGSGPSGGIPVD
ncbi:MAG: hypothetical protein LBG44_08955 [Gemmatimonadota bacterium]|jgi:polyhydroxyalkanoate synthesis regulator phasin|nr:hypothetical protein [Gemmatimonadota bacterium]